MSYVGGTWRCGGLGPVDCQLSSWSEWGPFIIVLECEPQFKKKLCFHELLRPELLN